MSNSRFELPAKIDSYLATLNRLYEKKDNQALRNIVINGIVSVHEGWEHDNWDGGIDGHAVTLVIPESLYFEVIENTNELSNEICSDLNKLNNVQGEYFSQVFIEMEPEGRDGWRKKTGILRSLQINVPPKAIKRIWEDGKVRVFLSHKVDYKQQTEQLKEYLKYFGISAFVAHTSIHPTREWEDEILNALRSMDVFVALITDNFRDSVWTDQEIGAAIARGVTIIPVKLGSIDPYGFIGRFQALTSQLQPHRNLAKEIFQLLIKSEKHSKKSQEAALREFYDSSSYSDIFVTDVLPHFSSLSEKQIADMQKAYAENDQLHGCYLVNKN